MFACSLFDGYIWGYYLIIKMDKKQNEIILKKQNYKCKLCNKNLITSNTHHIDKNNKNDNQVNLISLCKRCHSLIHSNKKVEAGLKFCGFYPDRSFLKKLNFYKNIMRMKIRKHL